MARIKYYYDTETCKYERVKTKTSDVVLNALGLIALVLIMASGIGWAFYTNFDSPKEIILKKRKTEKRDSKVCFLSVTQTHLTGVLQSCGNTFHG